MAAGPKQILEPAQIRSACNVLSIDMLREMLSQSRQFEAAKLWYARKEQLIAHIEKEVLAAGAMELITKLSYGNVHAWLQELDEVVDDQNLYDMRQALYRLIEGTPLAFIGILGEGLLRNIAAEIRLDATVPKDEVRGTIKDEMQLEGLESFLDRLSPEQLQRLWAEWGLLPATPPSDKVTLIERLVMWVFDIGMDGEEADSESYAEADADASIEDQAERMEMEEDEIEQEAAEQAKGEHQDEESEMKEDHEAEDEDEGEGEQNLDGSMNGLASVSVSAIAGEDEDDEGKAGEEDGMEELELELSTDAALGSLTPQEQSVDRPAEASIHEESVFPAEEEEQEAEEELEVPEQVRTEEVAIQTETVAVTELSGFEISVEEVVVEEGHDNAFQQEPIVEEAVILSMEESDDEEEENKEQTKEEELAAQPAAAAEKEEEAALAVQMPSEARDEEEVNTEEASAAPAKEDDAAEQQQKEEEPLEKPQAEKEEEETEKEDVPVPSTPSRRASRLLSNIGELKPGLTHDDLEGFSNTVLRQYCRDHGLAHGRTKKENIASILAHWASPESATPAEGNTTPRKRAREDGEQRSESESEMDQSESETETSASERENDDGLTPRRRMAKRRRRATEIVDLLSLNATPTAARTVRRSARRSMATFTKDT